MSEWKEYKIEQAADISTGYAFKGDEYEFRGELRVVRGENVTIGDLRWDSQKFWNKTTNGLEQYFLREKDIVIGMDGSRVGHNRAKIKAQELPLILAQRVARLRAKANFDQDFLWYYIFSDSFKDYVEAIHTGTSIPHISQKQIASFEIFAPSSKTEQRAIASILSSLDDKIDLLHRQNTTLEKMAETLFRQWFVEEAKEEWEEVELGKLIEINGGFSYKGEFIGQGNALLLGMGCVSHNDRFLLSGARPYSGDCPEKYLIKPGDLVIATRQQSDNMPILGFPAIIPNVFEGQKIIVGANLYKVINKSQISTYLIYLLLRTIDYRNHILASSKGSTVRMITKDAIESFEVSLPPNDILKHGENILTSINSKSISILNQIRTLTQLRDTLLPKLMSGEVRVNN